MSQPADPRKIDDWKRSVVHTELRRAKTWAVSALPVLSVDTQAYWATVALLEGIENAEQELLELPPRGALAAAG